MTTIESLCSHTKGPVKQETKQTMNKQNCIQYQIVVCSVKKKGQERELRVTRSRPILVGMFRDCMIMLIKCKLQARLYSKCVIFINAFNCHSNPMR